MLFAMAEHLELPRPWRLMLTAGWNLAESLGLPVAGYAIGAKLGGRDAGMLAATGVPMSRIGPGMDEVVDAMRAELEKRPGVLYNFSQPIKDRVEESISGIRGQIVVKIYGEDLELMHQKLEEIRHILIET